MPAAEQKRPPKLARTGFGPRVEIERAIFAELCQQLGMTFSWPEQSDVSELERQKTIEREQIAAQIVSHDECGGLRVRAEIFRELLRVAETLDDPAEISSELSDRLDLGPDTKE